MPLNRELLASLTFEPWDASDDSGSDGPHKGQADKPDEVDNDGDEESGQNEATRLVIRCLKLALAESITSISHPEKQRPLNPKRDFTIEATTEYTRREEEDAKGGISCCGPNSGQTKNRRREDGHSHARSRRARQHYTETSFGLRAVTDADDSSRRGAGGGGTLLGAYYGSRIGAMGAAPSSRSREGNGMDTASTRLRRRRGMGGARSDIQSASEDDEDDGEEDDTPPVDFKFTDYSPMCYRHIREFFGVDPKEYCEVLRYSRWHSIPTPGKSAAQLFFCGRDWVIKTMTKKESEFLREILHRYYYHVRDNPYTLLPHFVGHHHLQIGTETHNFIIMQNVFATTNTIHEKFDLKGSTIGRYASEAEKLRATCTQKDLDIHRPLHIGPERRELLIEQVKADCDFLKRSMIMDYSFLVGIHVLPQKRPVLMTPARNTGSVAGTDSLGVTQNASSVNYGGTPLGQTLDAGAMTSRTFVVNALQAGAGGVFPETSHSAQQHHTQQQQQQQQQQPRLYTDGRCFISDQGGMMSNDVPGLRREIYYIGIIDILQEYNARKRLETAVFGTIHDFHRISCVNPNDYAARFIAFMASIIV